LDSVFVRVDDLVKDGAKRRRLRRSMILDKIINTNNSASKRSRPTATTMKLLASGVPVSKLCTMC